MRIDWKSDPNAPRCRVINLDTGKQIPFCAMADEETGEYEQWRTFPSAARVLAPDGRVVTDDGPHFGFAIGPDHRPILDRGRARLKIEPLTVNESYLMPV